MSDMNSRGDGAKARGTAEDEAALSERLRSLGHKLDKVREEEARRQPGPPPEPVGMRGLGFALRVASEFISGILVGAGLGWLIDHWLGTAPWGLIILLMLGFVAGIFNVLRATGRMAQPEERQKKRPGNGQS